MDQKKNNIKQTLITVFTGVFSVVISLSVMSMMQKQNDAIISFATLSDLQNMYSNPTEEDLKGKQFAVGNEIYEYSEGQWRSTGEITNAVAVRYITEEGAPGKDGADGVDGKDGVNGLDGKNGVDGINGTDGKDGVDGKDGEDGLDGKDGRDGVDGKDGKDGVDGINGKDGKDGLNGKDGKNGIDGKDGINGKDGIDGKDGRDGRDGIDGKDGLTTSVNGIQHIDGNVTITLDDIEDGQQRLLSPIADETNLGQVMVGEGLSVDNTGLVSVNTGEGLQVNNDGSLGLSLGDGLSVDATGKLKSTGNIDWSDVTLLGRESTFGTTTIYSDPDGDGWGQDIVHHKLNDFTLSDDINNYQIILVKSTLCGIGEESGSYFTDYAFTLDNNYHWIFPQAGQTMTEFSCLKMNIYNGTNSCNENDEILTYRVKIKNGKNVSTSLYLSKNTFDMSGYVEVIGIGKIS